MPFTLKKAIDVTDYAWPISRLGEALAALAEASGLSPQLTKIPNAPRNLESANAETLNRWVETVADQMGIEAEPLEILYRDVKQIVHAAGPALLPFPDPTQAEPHFLALLKERR